MWLYCALQSEFARNERYHNSVPRLHPQWYSRSGWGNWLVSKRGTPTRKAPSGDSWDPQQEDSFTKETWSKACSTQASSLLSSILPLFWPGKKICSVLIKYLHLACRANQGFRNCLQTWPRASPESCSPGGKPVTNPSTLIKKSHQKKISGAPRGHFVHTLDHGKGPVLPEERERNSISFSLPSFQSFSFLKFRLCSATMKMQTLSIWGSLANLSHLEKGRYFSETGQNSSPVLLQGNEDTFNLRKPCKFTPPVKGWHFSETVQNSGPVLLQWKCRSKQGWKRLFQPSVKAEQTRRPW